MKYFQKRIYLIDSETISTGRFGTMKELAETLNRDLEIYGQGYVIELKEIEEKLVGRYVDGKWVSRNKKG